MKVEGTVGITKVNGGWSVCIDVPSGDRIVHESALKKRDSIELAERVRKAGEIDQSRWSWTSKRQEAARARDKAIEQVERGAGDEWMDMALAAVAQVARSKEFFTTDDLWEFVSQPSEPRAMGAVMTRARNVGIATATDRTINSDRKECHARPLRVWKSNILQAAEGN